jgi:hypothetical protein
LAPVQALAFPLLIMMAATMLPKMAAIENNRCGDAVLGETPAMGPATVETTRARSRMPGF